MESKIAEFTILGRVGKIKPFEGKTNVTICANYPYWSKEGENPALGETSAPRAGARWS